MSQAPPSIVSLLLSDSQLARLAAKGDEQAVEAIFRRHQQDLYRFCLAMTGDPQLAQEATQSTLARVRRGLPDKDRGTKLKPWLYRIARDEVAAVQPQRELPAQAEAEDSRARARHLLTDLERLPQHQRAVLVMRELSGLDFGQIGSAFETSPSAARETLYEARLRLQQVERDREASCAETMRRLSDADGRPHWRLGLQLHLRGCPDCRAFRDEIASRRGGLALLAPLPVAVGGSALIQGTAAAAAVVVVGFTAADPGRLAEPERGAVGTATARSGPLATTTASPRPPSPAGGPAAAPPATARSTATDTPEAGIGVRLAQTSLAAAQPGDSPAAETPPPHLDPPPGDADAEGEIAAPSPSPSSPSAPVGPAAKPDADGDEAQSPLPPVELEPEPPAVDVADVELEPPPEPAAESPPEDGAIPLPAPPAPEAEPRGRRPDRPRHRDRPWRKHR